MKGIKIKGFKSQKNKFMVSIKDFIFSICIIFPICGSAQTISPKSAAKGSSGKDSIMSKIRFYESKKDTPSIIKYEVLNIDRFGMDTVGLGRSFTNNMIFNLFFSHSDDLTVLNKSLLWTKQIIDSERPSANHIDTYANLLYKVGRKKEAIQWQGKAIALDPNNSGLKNTLEKMKNNEPTWHVHN